MAALFIAKAHARLGPGGSRHLGRGGRCGGGQLRGAGGFLGGSGGCGGRARGGQRILYGVAHGLVHLAAVAKAHLDLGGVHVHVHARRVDLHIQRIDRLLVAVQHILVGAARGVCQHLVAHEAAIDVAELVVGPGARRIGNARAARDVDGARPVLHRHGVLHEGVAQHIAQAARKGFIRHAACGTPLLDQLAFVPDGKAHVGPGQRMAAHGLDAVGQLRGVALEEFAAGRGGEEQLLDLDRRALVAGGGAQLAAARIEQIGRVLARRAREDGRLGHRADGRQRLAAKAHGGHGLQVVQIGDLAGGMAAQCHGQLIARDAAAVVLHRDQPHAAGQQPHVDLAGARIQGVVHEFAHHRGRALDDFAGRDLADQLVGQVADGAAGEGVGGGDGCVHAAILGARIHRLRAVGMGCAAPAPAKKRSRESGSKRRPRQQRPEPGALFE